MNAKSLTNLVLAASFLAPAAGLAAPPAKPAEGGTPVNGLKLSLTAEPDVFILWNASGGQVQLTYTFTNVGDKPIKLDTWMLPDRAIGATMLDPEGKATPKAGLQLPPAEWIGPREKDIRTLATGQAVSFTTKMFSFPEFADIAGHSFVFRPAKPGPHRLRVTYAPKHDGWSFPPAFKDCWQGAVTSNEVAIDILDAAAAGPQPLGPMLRLIRLREQIRSLWAAEKLALDADRGVSALAKMLGGTEDWRAGAHAASGLMMPSSKATAELKAKAETFLLESLRHDYAANGLCEAGIYLKPTENGLRWLMSHVRNIEEPRILRNQGIGLLAVFGLAQHRVPITTRKAIGTVFLDGLEDPDPVIRQVIRKSLSALRMTEETLRREFQSVPSGSGGPPVPSGIAVKGLKLTLTPARGWTAIKDGKALPVPLTLQFTNTSEKRIRLNAYALCLRLRPEVTGPTPNSVQAHEHGQSEVKLPPRRPEDSVWIEPGGSWSLKHDGFPPSFGGYESWDLVKPGPYRMRVVYRNTDDGIGPEQKAWGYWTGEVASNEIVPKVMEPDALARMHWWSNVKSVQPLNSPEITRYLGGMEVYRVAVAEYPPGSPLRNYSMAVAKGGVLYVFDDQHAINLLTSQNAPIADKESAWGLVLAMAQLRDHRLQLAPPPGGNTMHKPTGPESWKTLSQETKDGWTFTCTFLINPKNNCCVRSVITVGRDGKIAVQSRHTIFVN